jgi:hypothetical protein
MTTFSKPCSKCERVYDLGRWRALACIGIQVDENDQPWRVLRNCPCGSTLSVPIEIEGDTIVTGSQHRARVVRDQYAGTEGAGTEGPSPKPPPYRRSTSLVCARADAELYGAALAAVGYEYVEARGLGPVQEPA